MRPTRKSGSSRDAAPQAADLKGQSHGAFLDHRIELSENLRGRNLCALATLQELCQEVQKSELDMNARIRLEGSELSHNDGALPARSRGGTSA